MKPIASMLIDSDTVKRAHAIRAHARVHRLTLSDLVNNLNKSTAPGDDPNFRLDIPGGSKVVYTVEQQPEPFGWIEHLSASMTLPQGTRCPPPPQVVYGLILPLFSLKQENVIHTYLEKEFGAVNLIFKLEEA